MKKLWFALLGLLVATSAAAQTGTPIKQSGVVTPTHAWCVTTNGVAQDCGTAAIPFLTSIGAVYNGPSICAWSALSTSGATQELCLGATNAGGAQITVQNFGSASALPLSLDLNGTIYQFPFSTSGVIGPPTTAVGDVAVWDNTVGTLLADNISVPATKFLAATTDPALISGYYAPYEFNFTTNGPINGVGFSGLSENTFFQQTWNHGDHSSTGKSTFENLNVGSTGPGSGQHFNINAYVDGYGMGDFQSLAAQVSPYGSPNAGGDEGSYVVSAVILPGTNPDRTTISSNTTSGGGSTTTTQTITGSVNVQTITVSSSSGFTIGEWVVVNQQATHFGTNNTEAVQLTAVAAGSISGVFRNSQSSGVAVTPALVVPVANSTIMGEQRYLVDTTQSSYSTGTITYNGSGNFIGSGTNWTNSMVGGDSNRPGCIAPTAFNARTDFVGGLSFQNWFAITTINSTTSLTVDQQPTADLPNTVTATIGGTSFVAGDTVALTFTAGTGSYAGWPVTVTYTILNGDTPATTAAALQTLINANVSLLSNGVTNSNVSTATITINEYSGIGHSVVLSSAVTGTGNETVTFSPSNGHMGGGGYIISPCAYVLRVLNNANGSGTLIVETNNFTWNNADNVQEALGPSLGGYPARLQAWDTLPGGTPTHFIHLDDESVILPPAFIYGSTFGSVCPYNAGAPACHFINFSAAHAGVVTDIINSSGTVNFAYSTIANGGNYQLDAFGLWQSGLVENANNGATHGGGGTGPGGGLELDPVWNFSGYHTVIGANVTDTLSETGADLINMQVGGVSKFEIKKDGTLLAGNVPVSTISGLGTGVATALGVNVGTAGSPVVNGGALGTPSSGTVGTGVTLGGVTMTLGSDAEGDIYYRHNGVLTRLAVGANNYVVTSNGTDPTYAPGTGSMVYLCTITASNSASINNASPTSGSCPINSTYTSYKLVFINIVPATNEKILELQIHSASGGASYKATGYIASNTICSNNSCAGGSGTTYIPLTYDADANASSLANAAPGFSGTVTIFNPSASAIIMLSMGDGAYNGGGAVAVTATAGGYWNTAAAVDGFQVLMDSGNLTSGSILVYGIE